MNDQLPAGWPVIDPPALATAKSTALQALHTAPLERYYDVWGDYAGATFGSIAPNDPYDVTGADLHALSMLSVTVGPAATRRVLDDGPQRSQLLEALASVDPDVRLGHAGAKHLEAAWNLHSVAKASLADPSTKTRSDPWVTAAKLVARKRPRLLPVRDARVRALLGLAALRDGRLELQTLRFLVSDRDIVATMEQAVEAAHARAEDDGRTCAFDVEPLRLLDAALWLYSLSSPDGDE